MTVVIKPGLLAVYAPSRSRSTCKHVVTPQNIAMGANQLISNKILPTTKVAFRLHVQCVSATGWHQLNLVWERQK